MFAASEKENAPPTWRSPGFRGRYRRPLLVRLDGAGFSHNLLAHIASGGGTRGRDWEFSVGWSCTDKEMDAIQRLPKGAWTAGIDQNGDPIDDTFVADLTGLLDLGRWHTKIPGLRIIVRDEPLHPRYRKRATERDMQLWRRYQLIATNTNLGQTAWLDARCARHKPNPLQPLRATRQTRSRSGAGADFGRQRPPAVGADLRGRDCVNALAEHQGWSSTATAPLGLAL